MLIDTKGGNLEVEPTREGSGTLDATDSSALRAAFELCQAGFGDVRYVRAGGEGGRLIHIHHYHVSLLVYRYTKLSTGEKRKRARVR